MKGNLIVTVGISGSGKSTWAHEKWLSDPKKYVIVNRDKIRELLFGFSEAGMSRYYGMSNISGLEKQVTRYEDTLINDGLNHGRTVIVDATHLTAKYLERFKHWNVITEVVVFEIELADALSRDLSRNRVVGDRVISKQYNRFCTLMQQLSKDPIDFTPVTIIQNKDNTPVFIFDIDGTLAHMNRDTRSPYDWHKVGEDSVDLPTSEVLKLIFRNRFVYNGDTPEIIVCTGRDAICLGETEQWLDENDIPYDDIYTRDQADQRADWIIKEEMWRKIAEDKYIIGMFDDRLQVVRRARSLGLKVFNVEYSNF